LAQEIDALELPLVDPLEADEELVSLLLSLLSEPQAVRTSAPVIATAPTVKARIPLLR
jgi:hypothetical protein